MNKELKSCPFCGRDDFLEILTVPTSDHSVEKAVRCHFCGVLVSTYFPKGDLILEIWNGRDV